MKPSISVTAANLCNGLLIGEVAPNSASSLPSSRSIPYAEIYSLHTGIMETPAEHIQRAAEDEAKRRKKDAHQ